MLVPSEELSAAFDDVGLVASETSGMVDELSASLDSVAEATAPIEEVAASMDGLDMSLASVDDSSVTAAVSLDALAASADAVDASLASVDVSSATAATALAGTAAAADATAASTDALAVSAKASSAVVSGFKMAAGGFLVGAAAVGVGALAVHMAGDFEEGMTQIVTGAGEVPGALDGIKKSVLQMSVDTNTSTAQLTSGLYQIKSAGFHAANGGLDVLKVAAEGAKVGNADLGVVAGSLTTVLTDYHMKGQDAAVAMNALTAAVGSGKMKLQDLAGAMGSVLPLASSLGISLPQVTGAIATMTNAGMDAQRASMNLSQYDTFTCCSWWGCC